MIGSVTTRFRVAVAGISSRSRATRFKRRQRVSSSNKLGTTPHQLLKGGLGPQEAWSLPVSQPPNIRLPLTVSRCSAVRGSSSRRSRRRARLAGSVLPASTSPTDVTSRAPSSRPSTTVSHDYLPTWAQILAPSRALSAGRRRGGVNARVQRHQRLPSGGRVGKPHTAIHFRGGGYDE